MGIIDVYKLAELSKLISSSVSDLDVSDVSQSLSVMRIVSAASQIIALVRQPEQHIMDIATGVR